MEDYEKVDPEEIIERLKKILEDIRNFKRIYYEKDIPNTPQN